MNMKKALVSSLAMVLLGVGLASPLCAQSVTFNVTGSIYTGTCSFTIPDTDLGSFGAWTFTGVGYTTSWTANIPITAANCTADISTIHMAFSGTADANQSSMWKAIPVSGQGNIAGVAIDFSTVTGGNIRIPPGGVFNWTLASANPFYVKAHFYQTLATVTAGKMKTPITVNFTYN